MATVTHYIRSYYNPEEREVLERETGQVIEDKDPTLPVDPEEEWRREASRLPSNLQRKAPPQFVAATIAYDEWGSPLLNSSDHRESRPNSMGNSLSGWYRSLTASQTDASSSTPKPSNNSTTRASSLPSEPHVTLPPKTLELKNKNNWFIMKAIQSEPSSSSPTPAPSLADILARDPPPLPSQSKFTPPVFLEIGPSNKGFGMLQRSGWNEGEALGPDVIRKKPIKHLLPDADEEMISVSKKHGKGKSRPIITSHHKVTSRRQTVEVKMEDFDDVSELRSVDVIDLTLSDSESGGADESSLIQDAQDDTVKREDDEDPISGENSSPTPNMPHTETSSSTHGRKALLTPIATVLKSDRLGIGLKAKTAGPYKASLKRVTHNAAALAAHVKAAEDSRLRRKHFGRGRRGFEKQHTREEENRKALLAYLNGSC
ncbi:hypothetical protein GALMADRAFT_238284 [Galerina marginata CBS 339.88]|uniref:G-patch domain-containing protein n=1 Tax=Galerina marginata (strain CBS 339.88) TaxID=685588 RepID=A0A067THX7_GALM3|nr:hypothetical protein GALMADRAFT_238284 [Galerina marginata CBS 339.88]